jgi:hypothetical protein
VFAKLHLVPVTLPTRDKAAGETQHPAGTLTHDALDKSGEEDADALDDAAGASVQVVLAEVDYHSCDSPAQAAKGDEIGHQQPGHT